MKRTLFACFVLCIMGCTDTSKIPKDVLPKNKMEKVLWDILQAERFSALFLIKDSASLNVEMEKLKLYDHVFALHKVSRDDFMKSYKYYLSRPDIAKVIFDSMSVKAERKKNDRFKPAVK